MFQMLYIDLHLLHFHPHQFVGTLKRKPPYCEGVSKKPLFLKKQYKNIRKMIFP